MMQGLIHLSKLKFRDSSLSEDDERMLLKVAKRIWDLGCITTEWGTRVKGWWLRMMLRRERTILVPLEESCGVKVRCDRKA